MEKFLVKLERCRLKVMGMMMFAFLNIPIIAKATEEPILYSGTLKLLDTVSGYLLIIAPISGTLYGIYQAIRKGIAEEEPEIKKREKLIKNTIFATILALCIGGLVKFVCSFYQ